MKLTGKCKKEFDLYLINDKAKIGLDFDNYYMFYNYPNSMQIGVLILYFDSVGIRVYIRSIKTKKGTKHIAVVDNLVIYEGHELEQAWTQVVEKGNEIRNEQLKKA